MANANEELNCKLYFTLINLNVNSPVWLIATVLDGSDLRTNFECWLLAVWQLLRLLTSLSFVTEEVVKDSGQTPTHLGLNLCPGLKVSPLGALISSSV